MCWIGLDGLHFGSGVSIPSFLPFSSTCSLVWFCVDTFLSHFLHGLLVCMFLGGVDGYTKRLSDRHGCMEITHLAKGTDMDFGAWASGI